MKTILPISRRILLILFTFILGFAYSQTTIAFNGAESTGSTFSTSTNTFNASSVNTGTPAERIKTGARSFQKGGATATLISNAISVAGYTSNYVEIWNAMVSGTTGNGIETGDKLEVYLSESSTFSTTPDVTIVSSGSNTRWGMSGTGVITTTAGTPVTQNYTTDGGLSGANAFSKILVNIPSSWSNVYIKIVSVADNSNENWCIDDIGVYGTAFTGPTITTTPSSISGLGYNQNNEPSASQSFSLSASNLSNSNGNINVTAPVNFEVSSDNVTFTGSLSIPYTGGNLAATSIYTRLMSGLTAGNYNGDISITDGSITKNVNVSGSVTSTFILLSKCCFRRLVFSFNMGVFSR